MVHRVIVTELSLDHKSGENTVGFIRTHQLHVDKVMWEGDRKGKEKRGREGGGEEEREDKRRRDGDLLFTCFLIGLS